MNISQMLEQTGAVDAISRELGVEFGDRPGGRNGVAAVNPVGLSKPGGSSGGASVRERFSWPGRPGRPGGTAGVDRTTGGRRTPRQCHLERANAGSQRRRDTRPDLRFEGRQQSRGGFRVGAVGRRTFAPEEDAADPRDGRCGLRDETSRPWSRRTGGALGGILGGEPSQGSPDQTDAAPSASGGILGDLIGAAGKYLGR